MDQLTLEPICNTQEHNFRRRAGYNHCDRCQKKNTDYKCQNCYRELCDKCQPLYIQENIYVQGKEYNEELRQKIRNQDVQMNKYYYQQKSHRIIGRKIEDKSPPRGLKTVLGFFK